MAEENYAFIKGDEIVNVAVFDTPSEELLNHFKEEYDLDILIKAPDNVMVGGTYDGNKFWLKKPFPSWVKNEEENRWEAPVPYPDIDPETPKYFYWVEETLSWKEAIYDEKTGTWV